MMALYRHNGLLLPERRGIMGAIFKSLGKSEHGSRAVHHERRFGRITKQRLCRWVFLVVAIFSIYSTVFGLRMFIHAKMETSTSIAHYVEQDLLGSGIGTPPKSKHRKKYFPCEVEFMESIDDLVEPSNYINFTQFSLEYIDQEEKPFQNDLFEPRFGGHQTLEEREKSFFGRNQRLHCGFIKGPEGYSSSGFDLDEKDKTYMYNCKIVVSSCIFGSSDFLRRPTSKLISQYSKNNVCFVMFVDEQTLLKLSSEGNSPDDGGYIGLWKIVVVRNLPYTDMRRTGKVPKFLSHRLFPASRYSIWLDSKMRLQTDPMLIIEYFLWRRKAEYAISNHYRRHCVWEEVLQNKRLNKYNHTAIDEQFNFYQSDGLTKFDPSNPDNPLPSCASPWSLCSLEVLSPFSCKDCERRALAKLFHHRAVPSSPAAA